MLKINNSVNEWQELIAKYKCGEISSDKIVVNILQKDVSVESVSNIRYFFPLANWIRNSAKKQPVQLHIELDENLDNKEKQAFKQRIIEFLASVIHSPHYEFYISGEKISEKQNLWTPGNIFPLYEFCSDDNDNNACHYSVLRTMNPKKKNKFSEFMHNYRDLLQEKVIQEDEFKNTQQKNFAKMNRQALSSQVRELLHEQLPQMDILSQIIWLYMLKILKEEKLLWQHVNEDNYTVDKNILTKSRMDAVAYGEGLYQLIENSCLHSEGKRAWLGLRIHRAGKNVSITKLPEEVSNRKRLYTKYSNCLVKEDGRASAGNIFNDEYRFYFEMYVIDDADTQNGIVNTYNRTINEKRDKLIRQIYEKFYKEEYTKKKKEWKEKCKNIEAEKRHEFFMPEYSEALDIVEDIWRKAEEATSKKHKDLYNGLKCVDRLSDVISRSPYVPNHSNNNKLSYPEVEYHIEDITTHYGLRLLKDIVESNKGLLICKSPNGIFRQQYYSGNDVDKDEEKPQYTTEWHILVPLSYEWPNFSDMINDTECCGLFGDHVDKARSTHIYIIGKDVIHCPVGSTASDKLNAVDMTAKSIEDELALASYMQLSDAVVMIELDECVHQEVEIFSKALFRFVSKVHHSEDYKNRAIDTRLAICFPNTDLAAVFTRFFSAFYHNGIQQDMDNVQIAICSHDGKGISYVNFVFAGQDIRTVIVSALSSAHYKNKQALEMLPVLPTLIRYNSSNVKANIDVPPIFPFALHLRGGGKSDKVEKINFWNDTWFINQMRHILNTDMQESEQGCAVNDIHIRLGSKIHLSNFFEAQLLFHNINNILCFAYLLVHDMLFGDNALTKGKQVVLLGYENYSAQLVQQIVYWLSKKKLFEGVYSAIIRDGEAKGDVLFEPMFDETQFAEGCSTEIVSILPVGTTLSTIYKMHNTAKKYFCKDAEFFDYSRNYCIVLANKDLDPPVDELSQISRRYWKDFSSKNQTVTLESDGLNDEKVRVKYMLPVSSKWEAADECVLCQNTAREIRPIISMSKTEIMQSAIFLSRNKKSGFFSNFLAGKTGKKNSIDERWKENDQKLHRLNGCITYSHIYRGNNHFQYYIDFNQFYIKNRELVIESLNKEQWHIDRNAYNIVLSPLQVDNAIFLQDILNYVFYGNAKLIHVDFMKSYREDVRTKFSHIAEEISIVMQSNQKAKINVYYVDNSIVSGHILNRARMFTQMLFEQSGIGAGDFKNFRKIFQLINRCSYDTINAFVNDPREDMCAYIYLHAPSFNVHEGRCQTCRLEERYKLLKKRSSTEKLAEVFDHLEKKQMKRTNNEYNIWLKNKILGEPSYFNSFKQWLFINVPESEDAKILSFINDDSDFDDYKKAKELKDFIVEFQKQKNLPQKFSAETLRDVCQMRQEVLNKLTESNINDFLRSVKSADRERLKNNILTLVLKYLVGTKNYMRLVSTHKVFLRLENVNLNNELLNKTEDRYRAVKRAMLGLIVELISPRDWKLKSVSRAEKKRFEFCYQIEWLISCIKIFSREHVVNYYSYRQAIVEIMSEMLSLMGTKEEMKKNQKQLIESDNSWEKIIKLAEYFHINEKSAKPLIEPFLVSLMQYQLNMTIMHRLANLQTRSFIQAAQIVSLIRGYHRLQEVYFELNKKDKDNKNEGLLYGQYLVSLPTASDAITRYLKSLKLATMTTKDNIPSIELTQTVIMLQKQINTDKSLNVDEVKEIVDIGRYIYMENINVLYSGMCNLEKHISSEVWEELDEYRPVDEFHVYMKKLDDAVNECLEKCYKNLDITAKEQDVLYQSPFVDFCLFWHRSYEKPPIEINHRRGDECSENEGKINTISYMLNYFRLLNELSNTSAAVTELDDLPYKYEELCRTICGFTESKMCYMVYCSDGNYPEIFAQSGYYIPFFEEDKILDTKRIDKILQKVNDAKDKDTNKDNTVENEDNTDNIDDTVVLLNDVAQLEYNGQDVLVVDVRLESELDSKKHFHIILQWEKAFSKEDLLNKIKTKSLEDARNILFMRQTLKEALSRHYSFLISSRFDCSYVRLVDAEGKAPNVLHLSDLHVCDKFYSKSADVNDHIAKKIEDAVRDEPKIDLLTITGDIVDGKDADSVHMEQNYRKVEKLLDQIVVKLWADDENYLSHDWRRRIIITTGNHDYAAMNQYKAALKQRTLSVGSPIDEDSGTMSKFAYFIDFLIRYLDPRIDELLRNELNELRFYRRMNLKVLSINCSSHATPRRTNKLGPDYAKIKSIMDRKVWKEKKPATSYTDTAKNECRPFKLCLAHYSDRYELSYFHDNYGVLPGWTYNKPDKDNNVINKLVDIFIDAMKAELNSTNMHACTGEMGAKKELHNVRKKLLEAFDSLETALALWEAGKGSVKTETDVLFEIFQRLNSSSVVGDFKNHRLYKDMEYYVNWVKKGSQNPYTDERISKIIFEISEYQAMSRFDSSTYKSLFKPEDGGKRTVDLLLAGHIHVYSEEYDENHKPISLVSAKLIEEDDVMTVNGYIIKNLAVNDDEISKITYKRLI